MKKLIGSVLIAVSTASTLLTTIKITEGKVNSSPSSVSPPSGAIEANIGFSPMHTEGKAMFAPEGVSIEGKINCVTSTVDDVTRVAGEFSEGTFSFAVLNNVVLDGIVMVPSRKIAYVYSNAKWAVKKLSELVCAEMPTLDAEGAAAVAMESPLTTQAAVPVMNSCPEAKTVLFLDFIGGSIVDPLWNGGKTIFAAPAGYTSSQVKTVFDVVSERYAAFSVNVTTDPKAYANAPVKSRMRAILTATQVVPGYGGYAYISSLRMAGTGTYSPTIPCFVFTNSVGNAKNAGEVAAHELGHTFGLTHDGSLKAEYYSGQGDWAPVMGTSYSKTIVQWSKGEYSGANNRQDDLNTIACNPGVGFKNSSNQTNPTVVGGSLFATADVVSNSNTARYFNVVVPTTGTLNLSVTVPTYGAMNTVLELYSNSVLISRNDQASSLNSGIVATVVPGTYTAKVYGAGDLNPLTNGYSSYGSIGSFTLKGSVK